MKKIFLGFIFVVSFVFTANSARAELALKKIMVDLNTDVALLAAAIGSDDFKTIEESAKRIANHDKPPAEEIKKIIGFIGERAPEFKGADTVVHDGAMIVATSAKEKDMKKVVEHFYIVLQGCVSCHENFRAEVIKKFY